MNPNLIPLLMAGDVPAIESQVAAVTGGDYVVASSLTKPSGVCTLTLSSSQIKATVASE